MKYRKILICVLYTYIYIYLTISLYKLRFTSLQKYLIFIECVYRTSTHSARAGSGTNSYCRCLRTRKWLCCRATGSGQESVAPGHEPQWPSARYPLSAESWIRIDRKQSRHVVAQQMCRTGQCVDLSRWATRQRYDVLRCVYIIYSINIYLAYQGAELFAKRRKRSEKWIVDGTNNNANEFELNNQVEENAHVSAVYCIKPQ